MPCDLEALAPAHLKQNRWLIAIRELEDPFFMLGVCGSDDSSEARGEARDLELNMRAAKTGGRARTVLEWKQRALEHAIRFYDDGPVFLPPPHGPEPALGLMFCAATDLFLLLVLRSERAGSLRFRPGARDRVPAPAGDEDDEDADEARRKQEDEEDRINDPVSALYFAHCYLPSQRMVSGSVRASISEASAAARKERPVKKV